MRLLFEWSESKAQTNQRKHKVDFEEAKTIFDDPLMITFADSENSEVEERRISLGLSAKSRILLLVHTEFELEGDALIIRIISCRKATAAERRVYERGEP